MKKNELKVLSGLMKNSRTSDRELANKLGISQPTVSRTRKSLEDEGYIKEYTIIPDFCKLGFEMLAITFLRLRKDLDEDAIKKAREMAKKDLDEGGTETILLERGMGLGANGVVISLHESFQSYTKFKNRLKNYTFLNVAELDSFIVNLKDDVHYKPLTLRTITGYLLELEERKE